MFVPVDARRELEAVLESLTLADVSDHWQDVGKVGVQTSLNAMIRARLTGEPYRWTSEVPVFAVDETSKKGFWSLDFRKDFGVGRRVGVEVTFNHQEAMAWTVTRLALSHEAEDVLPLARTDCGMIVIASDHLKAGVSLTRPDKQRIDSAVGTYERLRTLLPKLRYYVHLPLLIYALDWEDGAQVGDVDVINLHATAANLPPDG